MRYIQVSAQNYAPKSTELCRKVDGYGIRPYKINGIFDSIRQIKPPNKIYEHTLLYFALQRHNALSKSQCYAGFLKTSAAVTSKSRQPKNKKSETLHSNIISHRLQKSNCILKFSFIKAPKLEQHII